MKWDVSDFNERFNRWKNGESYWDLRNINLNSTVDIPSSVSQDYIKSYVDDYFRNYDNGKDNQLVEYIKTIENPDSVGYDPETNTWNRVQMEGFDPNTYGYGLDYRYFDNSILNDDGSMDHDVMLNHVDKKLKYYEGAAKRNGVDKNKMSNDDYLLSIGAMYRGDAKDVYNAVAKYNILKPGEFKKEIYNKYKRQGLNERIRQSEKFFNNKKQKSFVKSYNMIEDLKNQNLVPAHDLRQFHDNMMYILNGGGLGGDKKSPVRGYMQGTKGRHMFRYLEDMNNKNVNKISKLKFDNGKDKPGYYQFMEDLADKKAQEWTTIPFLPLNPDIVLTQMLNDNTYNYRQWYNDLPFGATVNDFKGHFPDTYKTVYHPTFSNESMYSPNNNKYIPNTQYNPNNITGGRWDGNNYILSKDQIDNNWNIDRTVDYLLKGDPGVKLIIPQYNSGKNIHIKKENRGKFTAAANKHGMSVQAFATKVLNAPKGKYSSTLRKRANFAKNASKWHK